MAKQVNPYSRLLDEVKQFAFRVKHPQRKTMWRYPKDKLSERWSLADLYERVAAANQLDYDVRLTTSDDGLIVEYIKRPTIPYMWV